MRTYWARCERDQRLQQISRSSVGQCGSSLGPAIPTLIKASHNDFISCFRHRSCSFYGMHGTSYRWMSLEKWPASSFRHQPVQPRLIRAKFEPRKLVDQSMQRVGLLPRQIFDAVKEYGLRLEARQTPVGKCCICRSDTLAVRNPPLFWKRWFEPTVIVTCVR